MHFALPPKDASQSAVYARAAARSSTNRRKRFEIVGYVVLGLLTFYVVLRYAFAALDLAEEDTGVGDENIVIVTVFDETEMSDLYIQSIKTNREYYAAKHGYKNFYTNVSTYSSLIEPAPSSWALVPALRHALTIHPESTHLFSLSANALFMNCSLSIKSHILEPHRLTSLMLRDIPVVPPDSVIRTFSHLTAAKIDLIMTQDHYDLAHGSLLLRNSDWAKYFLDAWFDPLYRSYNFQKAEAHALEHIVQWHPTILAKLALVPQRVMNSYNVDLAGDTRQGVIDGMWQEGDFLIRLKGCEAGERRVCEMDMMPYYETWRKTLDDEKAKNGR